MTNSTHFHMYIYYKRERFPRTFLGVGAETLLPTGVSCFLFFLPPVSQSGPIMAVRDCFFISAPAGRMPWQSYGFFVHVWLVAVYQCPYSTWVPTPFRGLFGIKGLADWRCLPSVSPPSALVAVLDFLFISARAGIMPGRCHRFFYFCLAGGWLLTIIRFHKFAERSEGTALVYNK